MTFAYRPGSRRWLRRGVMLTLVGSWGCTSHLWRYEDQDAGDAGTSAGAAGAAGRGGASGTAGATLGGSSGGGTGGLAAGGSDSAGEDGGAPRPGYLDVTPTLNDPNATASARRLMHFLSDSYGRTILSGQQDRRYVETVLAITGEEPALLGLDLMDYSPSRVERGANGNAVEEAVSWSQGRGGIVTLVWHWNAPSHLIDQPGQEWWRGFYTSATTFDVAAAMADPTSTEYQEIVRDIDAIAVPLKELADADVPVLFRPLHEASGRWFWWGAKGPEAYLALWHLLYERLTVQHDLHNLIWVWNGQHASWYPGDATVDIVSEDIYVMNSGNDAQYAKFEGAARYSSEPKLVTLSENGALLDPDEVVATGAAWSWFCVWSGDEFIVNETWNTDAMKRKVYSHEYVTTLDELPDLASYPLP